MWARREALASCTCSVNFSWVQQQDLTRFAALQQRTGELTRILCALSPSARHCTPHTLEHAWRREHKRARGNGEDRSTRGRRACRASARPRARSWMPCWPPAPRRPRRPARPRTSARGRTASRTPPRRRCGGLAPRMRCGGGREAVAVCVVQPAPRSQAGTPRQVERRAGVHRAASYALAPTLT